MAKRPPPGWQPIFARRGRIIDVDDNHEIQRVTVEWLDEPPPSPPRQPTLREQMILAIVRRRYHRGIPANVSVADVHRHVADVWKAECERRKIKPSQAPGRDSVTRALRHASLIH
jgi:hypothetical protein